MNSLQLNHYWSIVRVTLKRRNAQTNGDLQSARGKENTWDLHLQPRPTPIREAFERALDESNCRGM